MTRFGPDFGRTFDSTFEPDLSIFAISAICLNLKQPRLEECPRGDDAAQQVVSDTHRSSLRDRECPRVDDGSDRQSSMGPDDGLNQLLPVPSPGEQEPLNLPRSVHHETTFPKESARNRPEIGP